MKFILTKELGRLAKWLRILGYDSKFYRQDKLSTLVIQALREERVILTRNSRLSRFPGPRVVKIDSDFVDKQIKQVLGQIKLKAKPKEMFSRCTICNAELDDVAKGHIKNKVPEYVYETQKNFRICPKCKRVYWQGTHWGNVRKYLEKIKK
ncbi:MAG: Mut7-C RNAse domain-containing protein [Candidatus Omnitrophica bacterium]|nr:Mut7-C RNAse domain-containing protein [Candidatus Omnitrophota bacterium]